MNSEEDTKKFLAKLVVENAFNEWKANRKKGKQEIVTQKELANTNFPQTKRKE